MEIFEAKKVADEILGGVSPISHPNNDLNAIVNPNCEETVTVEKSEINPNCEETVEKSEISVVLEDKDVSMENVNEEIFGNLDDKNEGMNEGETVTVEKTVITEEETVTVEKSEISVVLEDKDVSMEIVNENNEGINEEETVTVVKTVITEEETVTVETTEISAALEDKDVSEVNVNDGIFGNLDDKNEGLNEEEIDNGEKLESEEEGDHDFVVGDFVWGKIKSHPWWPGQIYDPSDASDYAARLNHKGRLLVAYFGDGSFSWCSPSQLKPFIDHFPKMSKQSDSKKFVHAVQSALGEVSRLVEMGLACKCGNVNRAEYAGVVNKGIKEGVLVPKGNTVKVFMDRIEPVELILMLKRSATIDLGSRSDELEFTLLKSCLNAFYTQKYGHVVEYDGPKFIAGLEHETRSEAIADSDSNMKTKSVAELLKEDEPKVKKTKVAKDGGSSKRKREALVVSVTHKSDDESDGGGGAVEEETMSLREDDEPKVKKTETAKDRGSSQRKRKALVVSVTPKSDDASDGGGGGGGVEEETMSPRQRKRSKYLSPPYLSPIGNAKFSVLATGTAAGSGSFQEPKPGPENISEAATKHLEDSSKKSSGRKPRQNRVIHEGSDPQDEENSTTAVNVNVNKVLQGLLRVALDPTSFVEKNKNLPSVTDFVSSYRGSMFGAGRSGNETDGKKTSEPVSELGFIKRKLEWMMGTVQGCEESKMSADVKASLEGGLQEVLQKVDKMKGK